MFKIDMSKASIDWSGAFCLNPWAMGFSAIVQDLIFRTVNNIWYSVNISGVLSPQFTSSSGVRQGDPLSPHLFIMAQQILSFNLKKKVQNAEIIPYKLGRRVDVILHLLFADDMLIFSIGRQMSLRCVILWVF